MSTRKAHFKARMGWARRISENYGKATFLTNPSDPLASLGDDIRVRITDAREDTAEKAVERVLQGFCDAASAWSCSPGLVLSRVWYLARQAGMTATVKNGKVRVRRAKP